ncbi:MAG: YceI family protein, partial [bacterium]|nr:YceI family protein [bacterium]
CLERTGVRSGSVVAEVTIRGVTLDVPLDVTYLGQWETPFWVGDENRGMLRRIGFEARTRINRHDFGVSWQDQLPGGGVAVRNAIEVVVDAEALLDGDLERTGAIEHYREAGLSESPSAGTGTVGHSPASGPLGWRGKVHLPADGPEGFPRPPCPATGDRRPDPDRPCAPRRTRPGRKQGTWAVAGSRSSGPAYLPSSPPAPAGGSAKTPCCIPVAWPTSMR